LPIAATAACAPSVAACDTAPVAAAAAGYRKDFFFPYDRYPEAQIPDPIQGGRIQAVATAQLSGTVTQIRIDGEDSTSLLDAGELDWVHAWPTHFTAGSPVWVAFHSRTTKLDEATSFELAVATEQGDAVLETIAYAEPRVPITYVAHTEDRATALVHLENRDSQPRTLTSLIVDGRDVTGSACIPTSVLGPGEATLVKVPLCEPRAAGAPFSVVATFTDASASVAVGRVGPRDFPIHTWPREVDCPFPGGHDDLFAAHREAGFDTFFLRGQYGEPGCNALTSDAVIASAPEEGFRLMPDEFLPLAPGVGEAEGVPARLLADEGDSSVTAGKARALAETAQASWETNPTLATYIGGSRHRHTGTFAGVADLQGIDFYVAACAPHVIDFGHHPPLRGAYDYLAATRENQMPGATWLYSQGIHAGWNRPNGDLRQPDPTELSIQAYSVVAAGGKGLMYFQTDMELALGEARPTWDAIGRVNHVVGALRERLREGDPTVRVHASNEDTIAAGIRARDALVVVIIDVRDSGGIDDAKCILEASPHWIVRENTPHVTVTIPRDIDVEDAFEVTPDGVLDAPDATMSGRDVTFPYLALDAETPARVLVLAASKGMREEVSGRLSSAR
jgi:hypothetical protein